MQLAVVLDLFVALYLHNCAVFALETAGGVCAGFASATRTPWNAASLKPTVVQPFDLCVWASRQMSLNCSNGQSMGTLAVFGIALSTR